jgi:competence protein ComEC
MGDAEISVEHDIINAGYDISADVLKVGHHGSDSSTSDYFIKKVKPKYAVISAGKNNRYGHPTSGVLAILQNNNIDVYRTDEVGTIVFTCDGVSYSIDKIKSSIQINAPPATNTNTSIGNSEEDKTVQSNVNNNSSVVYRTKTGSKYHVLGCSYLKSQIETTVSEAKSMGLTPCSRCNPPQ